MTADSDGFLGRWARRKSQARVGALLPPEPESLSSAQHASAPRPVLQPSIPSRAAPAPSGLVADPAALPGSAGPIEPAAPAAPPPTLQDAQQLTSASDFRPFVARAVAPEVRNAAFKQLFSDPHFNLMDGLDIYIDDYSKPDPLPLALARELLKAHFPSQPAVTGSASAAAAAPDAATAPASGAAVASASARPEPETPVGVLEAGPEVPARAQPSSDPAP